MTRSAITASGLRKSFGEHVVLDGVDLDVAEGTVFALLGPNGAGKTTMVQILSTLIGADARRAARRRPRPRRGPRRRTRGDRRHRPVLGRRQPAHGRGEPDPDGRPAPPRPRGGPPARRGAARPLRPRRRGEAPGRHLLRRHAPPARPRDDPRGRPADHLPRRADDRPGPPQPPHDVGDHPRARRRRRHDLPDDAVPRGGRPPRRPHRGPRPRQADRRGHRGASSSGWSPARTSGCSSATRTSSTRPRAPCGDAVRGDEALALTVPSDGSAASLRAVFERLDAESVSVTDLTVHTPDLDDVFLALTGS